MKKIAARLLALALMAIPAQSEASQPIHHEMGVRLNPRAGELWVEDKITLPDSPSPAGGKKIHFLLHEGLTPTSTTPGVEIRMEAERPRAAHFGMSEGSFSKKWSVPIRHYSLALPAGARTVKLEYRGRIHHPPVQAGEEYGRGFVQTPGIVSPEGVYLAGSSLWHPWFSGGLVTFTLDVDLPNPWDAVSQGRRTKHAREGGRRHVRWESSEPQEEIFLIGGKFTEYGRSAGRVEAMAFLREPASSLADKYLSATAKYLRMYEKLLGSYPYKKFALVENFWETGYGMPSFTLLGPRVIRLPFILHTSYPHEILHGWWGNGVFVDYRTGNWSEGLTAYLADQLMKEQAGAAAEYRRSTLQKYADYVATRNDFPLSGFRVRHSPATEAVGYGKAMMFFHMLRLRLGDETFIAALRRFYENNRFRRSSFADLQKAFEAVSGQNLKEEFGQWISRTGAPALRVRGVSARMEGRGFLLRALLEQVQEGAVYSLRVPLAVHLEGQEKTHHVTIPMREKGLEVELRLPSRPLRLEVDPEFDLFRRVHREEIPPALTQAFGAERALVLLPSAAPEEARRGYRRLVESWGRQPGRIEVRSDGEVRELPSDRAVWLLGWENRFRPQMAAAVAGYDVSLSERRARLGGQSVTREGRALVVVGRNPRNPDQAIAWVALDNVAAMPGLGRKLPHYGKYGYLVFEGDEPTNVAKGQWPVLDSPLSARVRQEDGRAAAEARGTYAPRRALAYLPEDFSSERMLRTIRILTSDDMEGRGFGSEGLNKAADFIAARFREAGLRPGGDREDTYFQSWRERGGEIEREAILKNVVGIIPGSEPRWEGQSVVLGAHYDHLGYGWPDAREGEKGKLHPGADDNASGVAVLLELAEVLAKHWKPKRTVVLVAFTGEEAGRRGSKFYVANAKRFPAQQILAMLNADTVGRLGARNLMILGTGTAREWKHIFRGAGYVTGISVEPVDKDIGSSDQRSFIDAGVPAVQLFSGPHLDYHRPTDTAEKIDPAGLVKVAKILKEAVEYLAGREESLRPAKALVKGSPGQGVGETRAGRRGHLGTVPDFAYGGKGVRISGVVPGSPAAAAGLREGDVIVQLAETPIPDLRALSEALKRLKPGDTVSIVVLRGGDRRTLQAILAAR